MLELCSGIVTVANLLLSVVIGVRLLRMSLRSAATPERWLAAYFLLFSFLSSALSTSLYMGWSDPSLALPDLTARLINASYFFFSTLGMLGLVLFARCAFRPDAGWATLLACALSAVLVGGAIGLGLTEGFEVRVLNGSAYWTVWAARQVVFAWLALESFAYWLRLRRRLQLGLADPLVVNRFLLWGLWGLSVAVMGCSDPLARLWYYAAAGTAEVWIPEVGRPIVVWVVALSSASGIVSATTLFLAFFPTPAFQSWVARRAATPA